MADPPVNPAIINRDERCAAEADRRSDPMLGTAFPAAVVLLVEQPGPWGPGGLIDSRFDRSVAQRLVRRCGGAGVRVLAIRRPGRSVPNGPRAWAVADCRPGREALVWGTFDRDDELLSVDVRAVADGAASPRPAPTGTAPTGTPPTETPPTKIEPLYAVCAHGRHDACCAMRGRPVVEALAVVRPGQVWECSHVGGDRFAANVLVLPSGLLYGRVPTTAAAALADATDRGAVLGGYLRGRVGFPPPVQAAMVHAHLQRPGLPWDAVLWDALASNGSDAATSGAGRHDREVVVTLDVAGDPVQVLVRRERADPQWLTCGSAAPQPFDRYLPRSVPAPVPVP